MESPRDITRTQKIKCPYCGYEHAIFYSPDAIAKGLFIFCKGRHCKKWFEIKLEFKMDK